MDNSKKIEKLRKKFGKVDRTIPNDTERQRILSAEMNGPVEDNYNEATQKINPINGREYDYHSNTRVSLDFNDFSLNYLDDIPKMNLRNILEMPHKMLSKPTNNFIEYQFALASMDVADGKISRNQYKKYRNAINTMVRKIDKAGIPVSLISNVDAFNAILSEGITDNLPKEVKFGSPYEISESIIHRNIFGDWEISEKNYSKKPSQQEYFMGRGLNSHLQ